MSSGLVGRSSLAHAGVAVQALDGPLVSGYGLRWADGSSGRMPVAHEVRIVYCTQCNWLLRAAWVAQELLSTFQDELTGGGVTLEPGTGGIFEVHADGDRVWSRKDDGGFPDIVALKRLVRDRIAPGRVLGHADRAAR
ncbi:SelT/SelW/SelH family protein [Microbacterium sp. ARD31]|jgi:selenoprotein W-related protein|uniref:SelT/SelW/SelH family protein n=2 Tax=unclassified Microbacterium TaxID=2609290 RepID=UPI0028813C52|nr:SelT/SelW/SelH family protein [Microbacterium sp. ARD31]MDT0184895.1 SelT/SelW/SelH family protein [Microbacterium sp. ARD31]